MTPEVKDLITRLVSQAAVGRLLNQQAVAKLREQADEIERLQSDITDLHQALSDELNP